MFHTQLRRAIALAFPDRYTSLNWRSLLADFVDTELTGYLRQRDAHEADPERRFPAADGPVIHPQLKEAAILRAKQEMTAAEMLPLGYYMLQIELAAERRQNAHLREQLAGYQTLAAGYESLADQAFEQLENLSNPDPKKRVN